MEALIIAAGKGSRLNHFSCPKPLIPILGHPLIEHIIQRVRKTGITQIKIVVGYKADQLQKTIGNGERWGVRIDYIHNPEWTKGNGISVYVAKDCIKDNFVLLMGDHVFDSSILDQLLRTQTEQSVCLLGVDHKVEGDHIDVNEATRVWVENHRIRQIGKGLNPYNGVDTGIFLYSSFIFEALKENFSKGKDLLTDANRTLSEREKLLSMDIGTRLWVDVDDKKTLNQAENMLSQKRF
ncbi:sugar phosphate nucleotidyltransferase [Acidobacteriota bacterium]